ncbi:crotonase/enoyl-CoA hydratase family protein [Bacillus subtilis]|uniref:crotonase/enoyl-CoA hydratase family protein n=1 Tax=Pseudochrobactrum asaccharolyticum TaxID=354351 RepID=UPI001F019F2B|nr:crotonase/enoyl-CoA hydratase family protein [Pseudochrobactrum asaccharolyticum]MCF7643873.1 crotonase/enoyl-CoA hydratase family protein [Pseudochrobactrum asaccharolyticum]MCF7670890.1 crotonase/enoyl-CoA hydratase family protein [Bacillus subtilis]
MSEFIKTERHDAVQIIRMNRPDKKNAITRDMYHGIAEALRQADNDDSIRVNVLLGLPGAFSAGNDMQDFMTAAVSQGSLGGEIVDFLHTLSQSRKPLISGVDGLAIGVGTTLNLHCDLTFATPRSVFHTPFVDLGLVPEAGSTLLAPGIMGHQRAFALLAMGEAMSAEQALEAGIVWRIVAEDALESEVLNAAQKLAARPPTALQLTRELMKSQPEPLNARIDREAQIFADRLKSAEAAQAVGAFLSRRK